MLTFQFEGRFNFDESALEYVFALSNGHPGAVTSVVDVLYEVCAKYLFDIFLIAEPPTLGHFERPYLSKKANSFRLIAKTSSMDILEP